MGFLIQPVNDGVRGLRWRADAVPRNHVVAGQPGFVERRNIWQRRKACFGGDGHHAQCARADLPQHRRQKLERHLYIVAAQRGESGATSMPALNAASVLTMAQSFRVSYGRDLNLAMLTALALFSSIKV